MTRLIGRTLKGWARRFERFYSMQIGPILVVLLMLLVGVFPIISRYDLIDGKLWMWAWLTVYVGQQALEWYKTGRKVEIATFGMAEIHSSLAGGIDSLTQYLVNSPDHHLDEAQTKALAAGLLHRIKDYTLEALRPPPDERIRVTLAVPFNAGGGSAPDALRVWCYDQTYGARNYTTLPLPNPGEDALPGSPAAFVSRRAQIIDDVKAIEEPNQFRGRSFRSVLSIPVLAGGPGGDVIAVVNIDATPAGYFSVPVVETRLLPVLMPAINILGLVLLHRRPGTSYAFFT